MCRLKPVLLLRQPSNPLLSNSRAGAVLALSWRCPLVTPTTEGHMFCGPGRTLTHAHKAHSRPARSQHTDKDVLWYSTLRYVTVRTSSGSGSGAGGGGVSSTGDSASALPSSAASTTTGSGSFASHPVPCQTPRDVGQMTRQKKTQLVEGISLQYYYVIHISGEQQVRHTRRKTQPIE